MTSPNYEDSCIEYYEMDNQFCNCDKHDSCPYYEFLEYPLCVPQDSLESLEGINFWDDMDLISIDFMFFHSSDETMEQLEKNKDEKKPFLTDASKTNHGSRLELRNMSNLAKSRTEILEENETSDGWEEHKVDFEISTPKRNAMKRKRRCKKRTNSKRRCSHCNVKETPQWRVGPLGRNTLCNACGMRYKSGRLLPEYRPTSSPTFDVNKHSNVHKKILIMRS